jgi:hypothetical protein
MNSDVAISDDLKSAMAKCKPGQSKTMEISVSMAKDGKITLGATKESSEAYEKEEAPAAPKKPAKRSKPVMAAIESMY